MDAPEEPLTQACTSCGAVMDVTAEEPFAAIVCPICGETDRVAATIDHFELEEVVGSGGMGVVYKALDTNLHRHVALKLLRRDQTEDTELISKLATEAAVTASINHPHVVKVYSTGMDHGRFYIAMELVDKGTLDSLIQLQERVAEAQVLEVGTQIAQGLRAALEAGLIHRDVKPGNILFADAHTAKIVDFGLAIFMTDEESSRGEVWGTPYYVAPEKLEHKPEDFRSDIYSLGGTLFHALAGRPPFEAEDASMVALKHLKSQAVSLQAFAPHVSNATAFVINRTLSKDPDQRYQSYDELIEHLEYARTELLEKGAKPQAQRRVVMETAETQQAMSWIVFAMLGVIVLMAIAAFVFRHQLFPSAEVTEVAGGTAPAATQTRGGGSLEDGRKLLLDQKPAEAAKLFKDVAGREKGIARTWAAFHEALAQLMLDQPVEARKAVAPFEKDAAAPDAPPEIGKFLRECAGRLDRNTPVSSNNVKEFNTNNYQAFALLLFGMQNWQAGNVQDAGAFFTQFRTAKLEGPDAWINELKPLVVPYMEDLALIHSAPGRLQSAKGEERSQLLSELKKLRGPLKPLAEKIIADAGGVSPAPQKLANPPKPGGKLPAPWSSSDLGVVSIAGSAGFDQAKGRFTIVASGADIWGTADGCHFVSQKVTGNFELVARVVSLQRVADWSKAGLMVRTSNDPGARCFSLVMSAEHSLAHQRRLQDKAMTTSAKLDVGGVPHWIKITRSGDTLTGFESKDGATWTQTGVETFANLPAAVLAGLAVTSHDPNAATTATFENVQLKKL